MNFDDCFLMPATRGDLYMCTAFIQIMMWCVSSSIVSAIVSAIEKGRS